MHNEKFNMYKKNFMHKVCNAPYFIINNSKPYLFKTSFSYKVIGNNIT